MTGRYRPCLDCAGTGRERTERGDYVLCDRCAGSCMEWQETPPMLGARVTRYDELGHAIEAGERDVCATCPTCSTWVRLLPHRADLRAARAAEMARREDERAADCDAMAAGESVPTTAQLWRELAERARENAARLRAIGDPGPALDAAAEE